MINHLFCVGVRSELTILHYYTQTSRFYRKVCFPKMSSFHSNNLRKNFFAKPHLRLLYFRPQQLNIFPISLFCSLSYLSFPTLSNNLLCHKGFVLKPIKQWNRLHITDTHIELLYNHFLLNVVCIYITQHTPLLFLFFFSTNEGQALFFFSW